MIGVVVRELTFLKVLHPVMEELHKQGAKYILYHFDAPRGNKEYNRATLAKLKLSSPAVVKNATKTKAFANDKQLQDQLVHDKVTKLVSLEIYLWAKSYIDKLRSNGIKIYNLLYLTDSLWGNNPRNITTSDRVYYSSRFLMDFHLNLLSLKQNSSRDRWLGFPVYDPISSYGKESGHGLLVLLPNLRAEHVQSAFGSKENFIKIMDNMVQGNEKNLVFKTRKKQWMPKELEKYGAKVIDDGDKMYPPSIAEAFNNCSCVGMFYSSGIYEAVYAGKSVINIPLNLKRWSWDKQKMKNYFQSPLYDFNSVVRTIEQEQAISGFRADISYPDGNEQEEWLSKYVGIVPANSSQMIVKDILD